MSETQPQGPAPAEAQDDALAPQAVRPEIAAAGSSLSGGFLRSAWAMGSIILCSRITGLLRIKTQAWFLGTGDAADAFRIALQIPSLFRRLVAEGAVTSSFVPVLVDVYRRRDATALRELVERLYTLWSIVLALTTLLGVALAGTLLAVWGDTAAAWDAEKLELTTRLTRWLFPYLFFVGLSAVGQGVLNALGVYGLPAATSLVFNLLFIACGFGLSFLFPQGDPVWFFVVGVLAGGVAQLVMLVPSLLRRGIRFRPRWPAGDSGVAQVLRLFVPGTFGAGIYQVNVLVSMMIAMTIPASGAVSSLEYSSRLTEFALGVFVFALSTIGLTTLSEQVSDGDMKAVKRTATEVLRLCLYITLPSAVGLLVLGEEVIDLLLRGGAFVESSSELTLSAFRCHIPGLVSVGVARVVVAAFYAFKDIWVPVRMAFLALVANAVLCWYLAGTALEHAGIALAATLSATVQAAGLIYVFQRKRQLLDLVSVGTSAARAAVGCVAMAAACGVLRRWYPDAAGVWARGATLAALIVVGAGVYFLVTRLLGSPEARWLLGRFRRSGR